MYSFLLGSFRVLKSIHNLGWGFLIGRRTPCGWLGENACGLDGLLISPHGRSTLVEYRKLLPRHTTSSDWRGFKYGFTTGKRIEAYLEDVWFLFDEELCGTPIYLPLGLGVFLRNKVFEGQHFVGRRMVGLWLNSNKIVFLPKPESVKRPKTKTEVKKREVGWGVVNAVPISKTLKLLFGGDQE